MKISIESPYYEGPGAVWLRGNLHTHSTRSDGALPPQYVVNRYKSLGYDFLMLSDHDKLGEPQSLDGGEMLLLCGNEITAAGSHLLQVGASKKIEPDPNRQLVIDQIIADGGFAILCHPNWRDDFNHFPYEKLLDLKNYAGIEILNGTCIHEAGSPRATDKWDRLLAAGLKVWGFGNDDMHADNDQGQAWNVVRAKERSVPAVLEALKSGSFYVSSGVVIEQVQCTGSVLHVFAPTAQAMAVVGESGARLHYQLGNEIYFDLADVQSKHVRVECFGLGDQMAWTQPFSIRGGTADYLRSLYEQKPEILALPIATEPKLSGKMDDPLWQKAEVTTRFLNGRNGSSASQQTSVRCLVSAKELFFGIRCDESQMDQLKTNVTKDGDTTTWSDDSVEIFLDPQERRQRYLHMMASAAGYGCTVWMPDGAAGPPVRIAASRDATGYTLEIAIELATLGAAASGDKPWGLHFCRNRKPTKSATYFWAWVGASNHTPSKYGRLIFRK